MSDPTHGGVLLAKSWGDEDPTGYWMSEKLDGVRAYWNGKEFVSRAGKTFYAPEWFKRSMPKDHLDGELFAGRGRFNVAVSAVRKKEPKDSVWACIKYVVFDAPTASGGFEDRLRRAAELVRKIETPWIERIRKAEPSTPYIECPISMLHQEECKSAAHLMNFHKVHTKLGAEGTMLRAPKSKYERKRSSVLLKVKDFLDAEAEVMAHRPGKGRHEGRLGALKCRFVEQPDVEFDVGAGFSDDERDKAKRLYPKGTIITVRFQEYITKTGRPRFPSFVEVRNYE